MPALNSFLCVLFIILPAVQMNEQNLINTFISVSSYYKGVRQMVPVSDQDMNTHLAEVSRVRNSAVIFYAGTLSLQLMSGFI